METEGSSCLYSEDWQAERPVPGTAGSTAWVRDAYTAASSSWKPFYTHKRVPYFNQQPKCQLNSRWMQGCLSERSHSTVAHTQASFIWNISCAFKLWRISVGMKMLRKALLIYAGICPSADMRELRVLACYPNACAVLVSHEPKSTRKNSNQI